MRRFQTLCAALLVLVGLAPVQAQAQNRLTNFYVAEVARGAGTTRAEVEQRMDRRAGTDLEIYPGIYVSRGAVAYSDGPRRITLIGASIYNESGLPVCVRAKAELQGGSLAGSRQNDALGLNFLVEPGESQVFITNSSNSVRDITAVDHYAIGLYLWRPAPPGTDRRCSSVAPERLSQWLARPLPPPGEVVWVPEL